MTGVSHRQFGYAWAAGAAVVMSPFWGLMGCLALFVGVRPGSTAPDWLEFGLIKHRTLTHLPWLWVLMYAVSVSMVSHYDIGVFVSCLVTGFCIGAISHLVGDIGTPMGVPLFSPSKRYSLNLWRTGQTSEKIPIFVAWLVVGLLALLRFYLAPDGWDDFMLSSERFVASSKEWLLQEIRAPFI